MTHSAAAETGRQLLGDPTESRSNCGVGVVMDLDGGQSHDIVTDGLELLENLEHRGTTGAESNTGDGAGILLQTPRAFFDDVVDADLPDEYAVGVFFLPQDPDAAASLKRLTERTLADHDLDVSHWRRVPTNNDELGQTALESEPAVWQCFVAPDNLTTEAFDRALYVSRRALETAVEEHEIDSERFYVCSLDRSTVIYKGLLTSSQLSKYYPDLRDERVRSTFVLVHARFSTNTLGAWHLAHPYRRIIHNGEFNTIRGNINWMRARETDLDHEAFGEDIETIKPIIPDESQSDTASVDNALELLLAGGRDLPHALRMLIPEAWRAPENRLSADREAFYDYHASLIEPWDGPALIIGTDGDRVAAALDRNGLRPCRYERTSDNRLVMASESGALELDISRIEERGRLKPGQLFLADPAEGRIVPGEEVFESLTDRRYAEWVAEQQVQLADRVDAPEGRPNDRLENLQSRQIAHGMTRDEIENLIEPMATDGQDPVGSMGDDTPLSVLSDFNRTLDSYFKQLFAQVSNPPIDNYREELVMSLETRLGHQRNLLAESPEHANQLVLETPVLTASRFEAIETIDTGGLSATRLDTTYDPDESSLETAVERLRTAADDAADAGHDILILSDRQTGSDRVPIPALLATAGVHHHLVRNGRRNHVGLVIDTGDVRTVHQLCTLIGYGAGAVNPYLAYQTIEKMASAAEDLDPAAVISAYKSALEDGLQKVMSKMGISTVASYRGAQIFEAVGLDESLVAEYFDGTPNRTSGIGIEELEADLLERHKAGFETNPELTHQGEFEHRSTGIRHRWNPKTVGTLQQAVRNTDYDTYREFAELVNNQTERLQTLRGLLEFDSSRDPVPLDEVEPVDSIIQRFATASMSLGSLSPEAHETLSIAMNRLGAKSGTGEGGEPPERFGTERECTIKQVASGRFGVTSSYLAAAEELQIKMAQGSKPGEGGHLPGHKVNEMIADVRQSVPGVGLISPPPQHDIYSIEDLKQLIYDLKAANPDADVNVKLVAEDGVGIIAAGCAKAKADVVHISGHSGGTGASPRTSIKNAGVPWELGLAEAHQLLREIGLRSRVKLSTDGGLMTGRDAAVAAMLGAEEFVFGTAGLVAEGCVMARQCHENTCPVGVATQDPDLRSRFQGDPEHVINYFRFIAREFRELLAELGFRRVDELVGRVDLLDQRPDVSHPKASRVDLSGLLSEPDTDHPRTNSTGQDHALEDRLDWSLIEAAEPAIENGESVRLSRRITNEDRTVGATLSNRIVSSHGPDGLEADTIRVRFDGAAGQSFGAFLAPGITAELVGVANDYLGKGLSGGKLVIKTPEAAPFDPPENTLIGNVALYGATGGEVYVNGLAGERFGVRNSGTRAVVEGVGDHGCEYMTGGIVAVLGDTGKNFAAGMSGGIAYVYDPAAKFPKRCNQEMVSLHRSLTESDDAVLRRLVENHAAYTGSERASELLEEWTTARSHFVKVMPEAYERAISERPEADARRSLPAPASRTTILSEIAD